MTERISDEQIQEVFELIKGSDSVELKATILDSDISSTVRKLNLDPLEAQIRQVVFFDLPDLSLSESGVVVRARRIQGGGGDSVIKLRPINPQALSPEFRKSESLKVEVDMMPGGFVCSASMKGKTSAAAVREVFNGGRAIRDLFSKEQREFYHTYGPKETKLNDLTILGPITLLKLEFVTEDMDREFVAEYWLFPDGSRILELSTKCTPSDVFQVSTECRIYLRQRGIDITGEQQSKTAKALRYFSSLLSASKAEEASKE